MKMIRSLIAYALFLAVLAGALVGAAYTRSTWYPWLFPQQPPEEAAKAEPAAGEPGHKEPEHVDLTPQAQKSLGMKLRALALQEYDRTLRIPGSITPQPGRSELGVTTFITGVIKHIGAVPGETVHAGQELFRLNLHGHDVADLQTQLYKTSRDLEINEKESQRVERLIRTGALAEARLLELQYEQKRLQANLHAVKANLILHGFTPVQIDGIVQGRFITDMVIRVPNNDKLVPAGGAPAAGETIPDPEPVYQVKNLKVKVGDQVDPGQLLCTLNNQKMLYLEGRVFPQEMPLVEQALQKQYPVKAEILDVLEQKKWSSPSQPLKILYMDHDVDKESQTVGVYVPLQNQYEEYTKDGKVYRLWEYRPGQRIYLHIPVEHFKDVFVLPNQAVVRDGPEAYVFRQNGNSFVLKPVQVLYEDRHNVVIANDGSILPGQVVVQNAAAQLYRALKTKTEGGGGHHHHHHD